MEDKNAKVTEEDISRVPQEYLDLSKTLTGLAAKAILTIDTLTTNTRQLQEASDLAAKALKDGETKTVK